MGWRSSLLRTPSSFRTTLEAKKMERPDNFAPRGVRPSIHNTYDSFLFINLDSLHFLSDCPSGVGAQRVFLTPPHPGTITQSSPALESGVFLRHPYCLNCRHRPIRKDQLHGWSYSTHCGMAGAVLLRSPSSNAWYMKLPNPAAFLLAGHFRVLRTLRDH